MPTKWKWYTCSKLLPPTDIVKVKPRRKKFQSIKSGEAGRETILFMRNSAKLLIPIFRLHLPVVMRSKPSIMVWTDAVSHLVEYFQLGDEQVSEEVSEGETDDDLDRSSSSCYDPPPSRCRCCRCPPPPPPPRCISNSEMSKWVGGKLRMTWLDRSSSSCYEEAEAVNHVVSNAPRTRHTCLPSSSYTVFHHTKTLRLGDDDKEEEEEEEEDDNNNEEVTLILLPHPTLSSTTPKLWRLNLWV